MPGRLSILLLSILICLGFEGRAAAFQPIEQEGIVVCPASAGETAPPDFSDETCRPSSPYEIDPQGAHLWVRAIVRLEETRGPQGEPLAVIISGKMAAEVYLNGVFVGRNGAPGDDAARETPGRMDAVLYPDQSLFRLGENELALRMSAHHGFLTLGHPIHWIGIGVSGEAVDGILRHYWPSLLTLGFFLVGAVYFGVIAVLDAAPRRALTLGLISAFAAAQLLAEVSRGLVAYPYPFHDVRLVLITLFSAGFGLAVAYHVLSAFEVRRLRAVMAGLALVTLAGIFLARGFDQKAQIAIFLPLAVSLVATGVWSFQRKPHAVAYCAALLVFLAAIFVFPFGFLDVVFFYLVAAFLIFLFVEQGVAFARETRLRRQEEARADRLALALEQARERKGATEIRVKSAGEIKRITTDNILHCRGAGGYTEIVLADGREVLHSASLAEMEKILPATFLRIHRSHVVNTAFVETLKRDAAGTGALELAGGVQLPVSRRILPKVREALG